MASPPLSEDGSMDDAAMAEMANLGSIFRDKLRGGSTQQQKQSNPIFRERQAQAARFYSTTGSDMPRWEDLDTSGQRTKAVDRPRHPRVPAFGRPLPRLPSFPYRFRQPPPTVPRAMLNHPALASQPTTAGAPLGPTGNSKSKEKRGHCGARGRGSKDEFNPPPQLSALERLFLPSQQPLPPLPARLTTQPVSSRRTLHPAPPGLLVRELPSQAPIRSPRKRIGIPGRLNPLLKSRHANLDMLVNLTVTENSNDQVKAPAKDNAKGMASVPSKYAADLQLLINPPTPVTSNEHVKDKETQQVSILAAPMESPQFGISTLSGLPNTASIPEQAKAAPMKQIGKQGSLAALASNAEPTEVTYRMGNSLVCGLSVSAASYQQSYAAPLHEDGMYGSPVIVAASPEKVAATPKKRAGMLGGLETSRYACPKAKPTLRVSEGKVKPGETTTSEPRESKHGAKTAVKMEAKEPNFYASLSQSRHAATILDSFCSLRT